jgi:D-tagatose-1,6-bisphosphate aldolase subunit GatZ/KbaZ
MNDNFIKIIEAQKSGKSIGICSICSSNQYVLEAAMLQAQKDGTNLLIESTSNQVDQFGGYSGMTPRDFVAYVSRICGKMSFPLERVILGGDHLGPNLWRNQPAEQAMNLAMDQIKAYVEAGYSKIHLDTSMRCADDLEDEGSALKTEIIAERAAELCNVSEQASINNQNKPLYVIGTEVPIPGGAQEKLTELMPTSADDLEETIEVTQKAFYDKNLHSAWERVIAVVVQPGVEFDDTHIIKYNREKARHLSQFIEDYDHLVFEAHSTDYQPKEKLKELVEDHFAILKVGPALTFAFREAVFALAQMEQEYFDIKKRGNSSNILTIIENVMQKNPQFWRKHYHGNEVDLHFARKYSFSDRIRYYWPNPEIEQALKKLINNLKENPVPVSLLSQYLPNQYWAVRNGEIRNDPEDLIHHKIGEILKDYAYATNPPDDEHNV